MRNRPPDRVKEDEGLEFGGEEWKSRIENLLDGDERLVVEIHNRSGKDIIKRFVITKEGLGIPEIDGYILAEEDMTRMLEDIPYSRFVNLDTEGILRLGSEGWTSVLLDDQQAHVASTDERDFFPDEGIDGGLKASSFVVHSLTRMERSIEGKGDDKSPSR